jgi:clan AA aspartic protease (TIGR02281 family)
VARTCYLHKHSEATGACSGCGRPICTRCTAFDELRPICPACGTDLGRKRLLRKVGAIGAVVGLGGLLLYVGVTQLRGLLTDRDLLAKAVTGIGPQEIPRDPGPSKETVERTTAAAVVAEARARKATADATEARARATAAEARARETTALAQASRASAVAEHNQAVAVAQAAEREVLQAQRAAAVADREEAAARQAEARARLGEVADADPACLMPTVKRGNAVYVDVDIDGHVAHLVLDTGATHTVVTQDFANGARFEPDRDREIRARTANGETTMAVVTTGSISIAGRSVNDLPIAICPQCALSGADGLLGVDVLAALRVQVDLPTGTARFGDCP